MLHLTFDPQETLLLTVTGGLLLIQILYLLRLYLRIPHREKQVRREVLTFQTECPPLSVILYARETCPQLQANLPVILKQDYPQFEVIVITDGPDDGTTDYLTQLQARYPHLYHSFIPDSSRYISHKKLGLTLGIRAAKYDWLVMTDPACQPASDQWLRLLARNFTPGTSVVLGYCGYAPAKGILHRCISYDTLFQAMRYLGFALGGHPYVGLGGNLAYRKQLFYDNKGFSRHLNLLRGDDDLFINRVATGNNTRVETDARAATRHQPYIRAKDWQEEKVSYALTSRFCRGGQRYLAGCETLTRLLFYLAWIVTLCTGLFDRHWLLAGLALLAFLIRLGLQMYAVNRTSHALGEKHRYYLTLPFFDLLQPLQSLCWRLQCLLRKKSEFLRK